MEARNCPELTDSGIKGLCSNTQAIETLDIFGSKVAMNGIRMVLESFPYLKNFYCDFPTSLLAEVKGTMLQRLTSSVSKIFLSSRISNNALLELLKLNKLSELHIENNSGELTFNGGILPLLKHFGTSLTSLSIQNLHQCPINIRALVENCHKLESLTLVDIETISTEQSEDEPNPSKRMKTDPVLNNLKTLHLNDCRHLTSEDFYLILASPALEELTLEEIDSANDAAFQKAENFHQFRNLERLKLYCGNVTKAVIDLLMNDGNPLKEIEICCCHSFSGDDICKWESISREKSWDCVFLSCSHMSLRQTARRSP